MDPHLHGLFERCCCGSCRSCCTRSSCKTKYYHRSLVGFRCDFSRSCRQESFRRFRNPLLLQKGGTNTHNHPFPLFLTLILLLGGCYESCRKMLCGVTGHLRRTILPPSKHQSIRTSEHRNRKYAHPVPHRCLVYFTRGIVADVALCPNSRRNILNKDGISTCTGHAKVLSQKQ